MTEYRASRTLVKSPPELWSEVSEASSLRRHLDQFGEIRITRLEPEIAVAWEGERARGTVKLEPSGWGTKVLMTVRPELEEGAESGMKPAMASAIEAEMRELKTVIELGDRRRRGRIMNAIWRFVGLSQPPSARGASRPPRAGTSSGIEADDQGGSAAAPALALKSALESLGQAHHRPYSRA